VICVGDPYGGQYTVIASNRSVSMGIESSLKLGAQNEQQVGITLSSDSIFDSRIRNTVFRGLHKGVDAERWCVFPIKNCRFDQNITGLDTSAGGVSTVNNVFAWNQTAISATLPQGAKAEYRNNTFDGNWEAGLELSPATGSAATVKDNLFTYNQCGISVNGPGEVEYGYNGFYENQQRQPGDPKEGDQFLEACPYHQEGTITKRWYLDQNCALIDAGSRSTDVARLLPYTTAYDESYDADVIDIGFHHFTATGSSSPDPEAPTVTITQLRDESGDVPPSPLTYNVDIAIDTSESGGYSTEVAQLYVDGEFVGNLTPLSGAVGDKPNAFPFPSDTVANGMHAVQALAQNTKPAVGRSEPVSFETYNRCSCLSVSARELDLSGSAGVEISALLAEPWPHWVQVSMLRNGWDWPYGGFPNFVPDDPSKPFNWPRWALKDLGDGWGSHVLHETWDGTDAVGNPVDYDSLYRMTVIMDWGIGYRLTSSMDLSGFSTPITDAEVAIFLPDFSLWDVVSAQAIIDACLRLNLPYRIVVDQNANWHNLTAFLTTDRPQQKYPSALYIRCHGNWELTYEDEYYKVTAFWLSDGPVYATTVPDYPGGHLPAKFVQSRKRKFISDPEWNTGLKDPRDPSKELSQTGWVKFVWIDACYSNVTWIGGMNDMARAFGMNSDDNQYDGDQSYIGFWGLTPNGFFSQWVSSIYTWLFWYYLSVASGTEPDKTVSEAQEATAITLALWRIPEGTKWWADLVYFYMAELNDISCPALDAKLKDHIGE
jgi:hypothetical protein